MKYLPLYALYLTTFGLAAAEKFTGAVPEWFTKQFTPTILNAFPGALAVNYYFLGLAEAAVFLLFAASLFTRSKKLLRLGLLAAQAVFVILAFGLRLSHDYSGAASLFAYFAATLLATWYVESQEVSPEPGFAR